MSISSNHKIRVAVLRGGPTMDYDSSLSVGEHVLSILRNKPEVYEPVDVLITKNNEWYAKGVRREPHEALEYSDVVWNALCGAYGEGGEIQKILSAIKLPYTGSTAFGSVLSMNKEMAKNAYDQSGLSTPRFEVVTKEDELDKLVNIFQNYLHPVIIKPTNENRRRGVKLIYTFDDLVKSVDSALEYSSKILVEEFIRGREAKCSVIESFRGEKFYALMPVEVFTPRKNKTMLDYDSKFRAPHEYLASSSFTPSENKILEHVAKRAHEALSLRHYSSSDLIMTSQGKVYVLESSPMPDFSKSSLLDKSLGSIGSTSEAFLDHVLRLAVGYK